MTSVKTPLTVLYTFNDRKALPDFANEEYKNNSRAESAAKRVVESAA